MPQKPITFPLRGGLNLIHRFSEMDPGYAMAAMNHEPTSRGYQRLDGFERYDGHPEPSDATFIMIAFTGGTAAISEGDIVDGGTSGASGEALIDAVIETGSYVGTDAAGYIILTDVSGNFVDAENLEVSAAVKSVSAGIDSDHDDLETYNDTWLIDAIETRRSKILVVPGEGRILGVKRFNDKVYAFRNAVGSASAVMHEESATGWVVCDLGERIDFGTGTAEFLEGEVLTGTSSSATGDIKRVVLQAGTWGGGDAEGYIIVYNVAGGPFTNPEAITSASGAANTTSVNAANTLPPNGYYDFDIANFYGHSSTERMYAANGVGMAFEWDGATFCPIETGMTVDTPHKIREHKKHLFLAFAGGSLQFSSIGEPLSWSVILGAGEIGLGQEITALFTGTTDVLIVYGSSKIDILYGSSSSTWDLKPFSSNSGAIEWTVQNAGMPVHLDHSGITNLSATDKFGDFSVGTMSAIVFPYFPAKRTAGATPVASIKIRHKDQYRVFYDDSSGLIMDLSGKYPEFMPMTYGMVVRCTDSSIDSNGIEWLFFGSDDGYVYHADSGTSFDGEEVDAFIRFPFSSFGSPMYDKRFHKAVIDLDADLNTVMYLAAEFDYSDGIRPGQIPIIVLSGSNGGYWAEVNWSEFYWGGSVEGQAEAHIEGIGMNASLIITSTSTYERPYELHTISLLATPRGLRR